MYKHDIKGSTRNNMLGECGIIDHCGQQGDNEGLNGNFLGDIENGTLAFPIMIAEDIHMFVEITARIG